MKRLIVLAFLIATPAFAQPVVVGHETPLPAQLAVSDAALREHWQTCSQPEHYEPVPTEGRPPRQRKLLPEWENLCAPIRDELEKRASANAQKLKKDSLEDAVQKLKQTK